MVKDCGRSPLVGIASVVCGVVLAMGILAIALLPESLAAVGKIAGYLVILGIVLGFFQYSLEKDMAEKADKAEKLEARRRR
jgi:hypothetical protein